MTGIVAATGPSNSFTQQTFEYLALANGCQAVDEAGTVLLTSPECVDTFSAYTGSRSQRPCRASRMPTRPAPRTSPGRPRS